MAFGLFLVICLLSHGSFLRAVGSHSWSLSGPGVEGQVSSPASWPSSLAAAGAAKSSELPGSSLLWLLSFSRVRRVKRHNRLVPSCCTCVIRMSEKRRDGEGGISKIPRCPWVSQTCNRASLTSPTLQSLKRGSKSPVTHASFWQLHCVVRRGQVWMGFSDCLLADRLHFLPGSTFKAILFSFSQIFSLYQSF